MAHKSGHSPSMREVEIETQQEHEGSPDISCSITSDPRTSFTAKEVQQEPWRVLLGAWQVTYA